MNSARWWLLGVAAVAAMAFAAGRLSVTQTVALDPLRDLATARFDWLGLTSAQAAELDRLQPAYEKTIKSVSDQQCQARCRLVHCLTSEEWDGAKARTAVDAMCASHKANEQATLDYLEQVRSVLTPEQRTRLMTRIGECLCEQCANDQGSCCAIEHNNHEEQ